jgi:altronate hydrolase
VLGEACDLIVAGGGSVVLGEIPECNGAEGMLMERAVSAPVRAGLARMFAWWRRYAKTHGATLNNNLSTGNIDSGITTIAEKGLGAVLKAGRTAVTGAWDYASPVTTAGLSVMNTPGYDPVSATGLVAGGCNMLAFTTGRGSLYASPIVPTVKISSTTPLYRRLRRGVDFNAGVVLEGRTHQQAGRDLFADLLRVAGGAVTRGERFHLGSDAFVPWPIGETL